jgi:hypothetical protein
LFRGELDAPMQPLNWNLAQQDQGQYANWQEAKRERSATDACYRIAGIRPGHRP